MPSYICSRCGFKTSQRANFKRHLTRKNLCDPINTDTPIKSIAESYGIEIPTTENNGVIGGYPDNVIRRGYPSRITLEPNKFINVDIVIKNSNINQINQDMRNQDVNIILN